MVSSFEAFQEGYSKYAELLAKTGLNIEPEIRNVLKQALVDVKVLNGALPGLITECKSTLKTLQLLKTHIDASVDEISDKQLKFTTTLAYLETLNQVLISGLNSPGNLLPGFCSGGGNKVAPAPDGKHPETAPNASCVSNLAYDGAGKVMKWQHLYERSQTSINTWKVKVENNLHVLRAHFVSGEPEDIGLSGLTQRAILALENVLASHVDIHEKMTALLAKADNEDAETKNELLEIVKRAGECSAAMRKVEGSVDTTWKSMSAESMTTLFEQLGQSLNFIKHDKWVAMVGDVNTFSAGLAALLEDMLTTLSPKGITSCFFSPAPLYGPIAYHAEAKSIIYVSVASPGTCALESDLTTLETQFKGKFEHRKLVAYGDAINGIYGQLDGEQKSLTTATASLTQLPDQLIGILDNVLTGMTTTDGLMAHAEIVVQHKVDEVKVQAEHELLLAKNKAEKALGGALGGLSKMFG